MTKLLTLILTALLLSPAYSAQSLLINGAGATFPYPLYSKWFTEYWKSHPSVKINYQSIGSGGGIRQLQNKTVDFGASDAPMTDGEMVKNPGIVVYHIPTVLGAVILTYNLSGIKAALKLTPEIISGIFTGTITRWNDRKITAANPGQPLPDQNIILVTRSDGSGTTAVFTDYLAKINPTSGKTIGVGKIGRWPSGLAGKGNEGVTGLIQQNPGAIGYVELAYAEINHLPVALVQNSAGQFIKPSIESVTEAAAGAAKSMPADFRVSITNASGKRAYPISSFTYLLVYASMEKDKGQEIINFLNWALGPGQKMAAPLLYAPLPKSVVTKVLSQIKKISLH